MQSDWIISECHLELLISYLFSGGINGGGMKCTLYIANFMNRQLKTTLRHGLKWYG